MHPCGKGGFSIQPHANSVCQTVPCGWRHCCLAAWTQSEEHHPTQELLRAWPGFIRKGKHARALVDLSCFSHSGGELQMQKDYQIIGSANVNPDIMIKTSPCSRWQILSFPIWHILAYYAHTTHLMQFFVRTWLPIQSTEHSTELIAVPSSLRPGENHCCHHF